VAAIILGLASATVSAPAQAPNHTHYVAPASLGKPAPSEGRSRVAIEAARKTAAQIPREAVADVPILQGFLVVPKKTAISTSSRTSW
jgi:hypothetical protein